MHTESGTLACVPAGADQFAFTLWMKDLRLRSERVSTQPQQNSAFASEVSFERRHTYPVAVADDVGCRRLITVACLIGCHWWVPRATRGSGRGRRSVGVAVQAGAGITAHMKMGKAVENRR